MVLADWTFSGTGTGILDASTKYAGNSSYQSFIAVQDATNSLTHDTFSEPQAQIICWARLAGQSTFNVKAYINHSSYGDLQLSFSAMSTWEKFKAVFWYDAGANTKFGRIYRWTDSAWVQQGSDTNFGAGSPSAGSIVLKQWCNRVDTYVWFDEVEISA